MSKTLKKSPSKKKHQKPRETYLHGWDELSDYLQRGVSVLQLWKDLPIVYKKVPSGKKTKFGHDYHITEVLFPLTALKTYLKEHHFEELKQPVVKNYKEPLKKIPKGNGFGYYGAITTTKDGKEVQCHLCGKFFEVLHLHIRNTHKIKDRDYKDLYNLAYTTRLVSDSYREKMKQHTLEMIKRMTPEEKAAHQSQALIALRKVGWDHDQPRLQLETFNKRGTCPDQLIDQIRKCQEKLKKTPSKKEFIVWCGTQKYVHKIYDTFGSWTKAVEIAKLSPLVKKRGGGKPTGYERWEDEELLEYLRVFYQEKGRVATQTDFYRGDLPSYDVYLHRFGTMKKARELAEIPLSALGRWGEYAPSGEVISKRKSVYD